MPGLDDRLREALARAAEPGDPAGILAHVARRKRRWHVHRRVQAAALVVMVIAGSAGVSYGLSRLFEPSSVQPASSEDGRIAFMKGSGTEAEIYIISPDGTGERRLTDNDLVDATPAWSPDGSRIAFTSGPLGEGDIYTMNQDGSGRTRLTNHPADDYRPTWSPDGSMIAFVSKRAGDPEIYVMKADGTAQEPLTENPGLDCCPDWAPSSLIAYTYQEQDGAISELRLIDPLSRETMMVSPSPISPAADEGPSGMVRQPAWSPDGLRIAFESWSPQDDTTHVFVMDADGSGRKRLTGGGIENRPSWSPDGSAIAFDRREAIFVVTTDGANERQITHAGENTDPDWQPRPAIAPAPGPSLPTPIAAPRCLSPEQVAADRSLWKERGLRGDLDGDGVEDYSTAAVDKQAAQSCRYFLVTETAGGARAALLDSGAEHTFDDYLRVTHLAEVNGEPGLEILVVISAGASRGGWGVFTMTPEGPERMRIRPYGDLFYEGSSVGTGANTADCTDDPGTIVVSTVVPETLSPDDFIEYFETERDFFRAEGTVFRRLATEHDQISTEEFWAGRLGDRYPEWRPSDSGPFDDCPAVVGAR